MTIRNYAMLDKCSQGSFFKQNLVKTLDVGGQKLNLNLKALIGEKSEETLMLDNLKAGGANKMNNDWISLSKVYSKKKHFRLKRKRLQPQKRYQNGRI